MHVKQIKEEIKRISKLEDPVLAQKELKILNKKINEIIIAQLSDNYIYFYRISYEWDPEKKRTKKRIEKALGRMPKEEYLKNKDKIKQLPLNELKKLLEPTNE